MAKKKSVMEVELGKCEKAIQTLEIGAADAAEAVKAGMEQHLPKKDMKALKTTLKTAVDNLNDAIAKKYYLKMAIDHGNACILEMLKVQDVAIADVVSYKFKEDEETGEITFNAEPAFRRVDLTKFRATVGAGYFHDDNWFDLVSQLSRLMAVKLNSNLKGSEVYKYVIKESVKDLGIEIDASDDAQMVAAFQKVIDGILFLSDGQEDKNSLVFGTDNWEYVKASFCHRDKRATNVVNVESPAGTLDIVCCCINVMLNKLQYKVNTAK